MNLQDCHNIYSWANQNNATVSSNIDLACFSIELINIFLGLIVVYFLIQIYIEKKEEEE